MRKNTLVLVGALGVVVIGSAAAAGCGQGAGKDGSTSQSAPISVTQTVVAQGTVDSRFGPLPFTVSTGDDGSSSVTLGSDFTAAVNAPGTGDGATVDVKFRGSPGRLLTDEAAFSDVLGAGAVPTPAADPSAADAVAYTVAAATVASQAASAGSVSQRTASLLALAANFAGQAPAVDASSVPAPGPDQAVAAAAATVCPVPTATTAAFQIEAPMPDPPAGTGGAAGAGGTGGTGGGGGTDAGGGDGGRCCSTSTLDLMTQSLPINTKTASTSFSLGPFTMSVTGPNTQGAIRACPGVGMNSASEFKVGSQASKCGNTAGFGGTDWGGVVYDRKVANGPSASDGVLDHKQLLGGSLQGYGVNLTFGCGGLGASGCEAEEMATTGALSYLQGYVTLCYQQKDNKWYKIFNWGILGGAFIF